MIRNSRQRTYFILLKPFLKLFFLSDIEIYIITTLAQNEYKNVVDEQMAQINDESGIVRKVNFGSDVIYIEVSDWGDLKCISQHSSPIVFDC